MVKKAVLFLLAILLLTSCCAFVDQKVNLEYVNPEYSGPKTNKTVYLNRFVDKRDDKTRIGIVKNAYGTETADVLTRQDVSLWLGNALASELELAGFNVKKLQIQESNFHTKVNEAFIEGEVLKVFAEPIVGFWTGDIVSNIDLEIIVHYKGNKYEKTYQVAEKNTVLAWTANSYKKSIELAIHKLMPQVAYDIVSLVK